MSVSDYKLNTKRTCILNPEYTVYKVIFNKIAVKANCHGFHKTTVLHSLTITLKTGQVFQLCMHCKGVVISIVLC